MTYKYEELRELVPPYINGRLSEKERKEFEEALDQFPGLKRELMEFSEIKDLYREIEKEIPSPPDILYKRILEKVKGESKISLNSIWKRYIDRFKEFLKSLFLSPRLSWGVVAVQFAIILILVITFSGGEKIRTLTSKDIERIEGIKINVVFDKESKEREIRDVLKRVGATIVSGPSGDGLYTIKVEGNRDVEQVLEALRKAEIIRFAEKAY